MNFRRRPYPEVLDSLLTGITKGVAAEAHPFPPNNGSLNGNNGALQHSLLQPPVANIVSVYGSRSGQPHLFRADVDYTLASDQQTVLWQEGAQLPDPGTLVQINYYPEAAQPVLTDIQTGSVVRTLTESFGLEVARLYAQLEAVYQAGFVDTASGSSLDNVVSLLGIERVRGGRATGTIAFTRSSGSRGAINIPAGIRILTEDGEIAYETTESVTVRDGQSNVRVVARDLELGPPLEADRLTVLAVPIAGIASVTNPAPTAIETQDETDSNLRTRAKNFLHGSERATLGAIRAAIASQGLSADVQEVTGTRGLVEVTLHADSISPEQHQRLLTVIHDARPAGVEVLLKGIQPPEQVHLELRLTTTEGLLEQDLRGVQREIQAQLTDYFERLPAKENGSLNRIVGLVLGLPEVQDVRILSATWKADAEDILDRTNDALTIAGSPTVLGSLQIADPNLPTLLNVTITHPDAADPPNVVAIQAALNDTLLYLNSVNANEATDLARRGLSYGKLLQTVPLPNQAAQSLQAHDDSVAAGDIPALPDAAAVAPYVVRFVITQESGLSNLLQQGGDPTYELTSFERLSLSGVEIQAESEADNG